MKWLEILFKRHEIIKVKFSFFFFSEEGDFLEVRKM